MARNVSMTIVQNVTIETRPDRVSLVIPTENVPLDRKGNMPATIGLSFFSPEHLLTVFSQLLGAAEKVWPDNELIREWKRDQESQDNQ